MIAPVELRRRGLSEFAFAVSARPSSGDWSALAVPAGLRPAAVAEELGALLRIFSDVAVHLIDATDNADDIVRGFETTDSGTVIVREIEPLSEDTFHQLDFARSRLLRADAVVLVLRL